MRMHICPINDPPVHPDVSRKVASHIKKKQRQTRKDEGLCPGCGDEPKPGISQKTGKPYILCRECAGKGDERAKDRDARLNYKDPEHDTPHPVTTTKQRYRVIRTGEVGIVSPCPGDNPLILEFKGNIRHVYHINQIEKTNLPLTESIHSKYAQNGSKGGGQIGLTDRSIEKMFAMLRFLEEQEGPVRAYAITKACGIQLHPSIDALPIQHHQPPQF